MRIGIDSRAIAKTRKSGIGVYLETILKNLPEEAFDASSGNEVFLYSNKAFESFNTDGRFKLRCGRFNLHGTVWALAELPGMLKNDGIELFWSPLHVLPLTGLKNIKKLLTIHDMVFRRFPETMEFKNFWINRFLVGKSLNNCDLILSDSINTERDIRFFYPRLNKPIRTVYPGLSTSINRTSKEFSARLVREKYNIDKHYILIVGTHEPRKNFSRAFEAFSRICGSIPHQLVSAGALGWKTEKLVSQIKNSAISKRITFLEYLDDEGLSNLYSAADLFLFPSLYEGFGLPPLEAMSCGCPVISSNRASLPEVTGDAAVSIGPEDTNLWASKILEVLSDPALRASLSEKGLKQAEKFNPKASARAVWDTIKELYAK